MLKIIDVREVLLDTKRTKQLLERTLLSRYHNYNLVKNHIAMIYSTLGIREVESTRKIAEMLGIGKSIVARVLLQLEEDGWIEKVEDPDYSWKNYYIVKVSKEECFWFRNFFPLSSFKKRKLLKNLMTCGADNLEEIMKNEFGAGQYKDLEKSRRWGSEWGRNYQEMTGERSLY